MDKSVEDIIKEAMEKKKLKEGNAKPDEVKKQKPVFENTSDYLISDLADNTDIKRDESDLDKTIPEVMGEPSVSASAKAADEGVDIPKDVFDSIINSRESFSNDDKQATGENQKSAPDFLADNYSEDDEDLTALGVSGKEGKKITDYKSKTFKKDSPKDFDKAYYEKYDKLKKMDEPQERQKSKSKNRLKKNGKKKWSVKKKIIVIVIVVLLILLLLAGAGVAMVFNYISKINIVSNPDTSIASSITDDDLTNDPDSPQSEIDALNEKIRKNLEENATELMFDDNVLNVLVIGTDSRGEERGRSDSMILMSLNKNTEEIVMTSFLRDIYLDIPGVGSSRLNHAYAYGGPELLMDTIEQNFKIKIDKYVTVNFDSFVDVIDAVGGVEINVTDEELPYVNGYLSEINSLRGEKTTADTLSSSGTYTLNGKQALAYSRIRYVGTDFGRTERQRTVMTKTLEKAKNMSLLEINDLLNVLLPELTTNLTQGEIFSIVLDSLSYLSYDTVSQAIPLENTYSYLTISGMSVLGIDFDISIEHLKNTIYK